MLPNTVSNTKFPYNSITTLVFLGVVILQPLFLILQSRLAFEPYGTVALIFALWTFLRDPVVQIKRRKMQSLSDKYPELVEQISTLPAFCILKNRPALLYIPSNMPEIFAFGTWRKHYIAVSEGAINRWNDPTTRVNIVSHELAHISNGDTWKTGFSSKYLYASFGVTVYLLIMTFPYSVFFNTYETPIRESHGVVDLMISLQILSLYLAMLVAVRFLYRMKEFAADEYARKSISLSDYVQAFALPVNKTFHDVKEKFAPRTSLQEWLFRILSFHPTVQARLDALQSPNHILKELSSLMFVVGLTIGFITSFYLDLDSAFGLMLASEITIGFIVLVLMLSPSMSPVFADRIKLLVKNAFVMANGIAFAFCVLVGITNLTFSKAMAETVVAYFRRGADLQFELFVTLDVLLLVLVVIPFAITGLVLISWFLTRIIAVKGFTWHSNIFSIISLSPSIVLVDFQIIQWWEGRPITLNLLLSLLLLSLLVTLVITLLWRLFSLRKYDQTHFR
ncbi:hypothetical protein CO110_00230 [Candidatus Desantisbacteria bacterium CG_4_9_14_3_um_filter_40_11]|uniref:Peptidase M48 domain-containing protein n=1 Tax=Candidatus Desantisbacteria bacterium CG_4_9_14_3_um_filter_40_11 TaxID=1974546 RepID=A0A2M8AWC6_9BACT|nr:MAG: hypothetical protein CO110_00230 [Candidatus Desantisbacteria bacterium CG_4_9_14_3_um_filter_40_11]